MHRQTLRIDGSYGEGGGQILRTVLALSAVTGRPVLIENIRARRARPGLATQHLTALRAAGSVCKAEIAGDELGSCTLKFVPNLPPQSGHYVSDVAMARQGGSAGSAVLVLQTILLPLALATGSSMACVGGGTHAMQAPFFDYLADVWRAAVTKMGIDVRLELQQSGWYPLGKGKINATITGGAAADRAGRSFSCVERGALRQVRGRALTANLPRHIARRMADHARVMLSEHNLPVSVYERRQEAACPGTGIFLVAEYEHATSGFGALGKPGKPA